MSIVGPRPERVELDEIYTKQMPEFALRLKVRGGLTGYAQVFGKYNTTPEDKLKLDLLYINQRSVLLDLKLILYTIKIMFVPESTEGFEEDETTLEDIDREQK
jgi:lipopolysaccharide/colanic/teichoic acid biosynthesis glycosyltransferase